MAARSTAAQGTITTPPGGSPATGRFTITTTTTTDHTVNEEDVRRKRARPPETTTTTNPFTVRQRQYLRSVHAMANNMVLIDNDSVLHFPAYRQQVPSVSFYRKGNVFTSACRESCPWGVYPSMHWGRHPPAQCMLGYIPLPSACWDTPPPPRGQADTRPGQTPPPPKDTAADGTHPTGMHSCFMDETHTVIILQFFYCR